MRRKKLIKKMAIPAGIIAIISLIILLVQHPYRDLQFEKHEAEFKKYMTKFMEENKNYIRELSEKINTLPVDEIIINELQSEYFIEHQQSNETKKYLWMSASNGNFLFGVPSGICKIGANENDVFCFSITGAECATSDNTLSKISELGFLSSITFKNFDVLVMYSR